MLFPLPLSNGKTFKISFKKLFFPALFFLAVIIVFFKFSELKEIGRLFSEAKWYWLVLVFISQILNFFLQGSVYQVIFKTLNFPRLPLFKLVKICIVTIFLNLIIPSIGFAGNLYLIKSLRNYGVKEGKALMSIILEFLCYYFAFIFLLILSLFYLFFKLGHIGYTQKIAVAGFGLILALLIFAIHFFLGNKERAKKRVLWLAQKIDLYEDGVPEEKRVQELLNDFYQDFDWLKQNKRKILPPVVLQFFKFLTDGLAIFLVFLAFGFLPPLGLGVVAFVIGRLFGLISGIPGGLGAFEGSMVLVLNSLGISLELSFAVMLLYRFFSFWLYFPLGLIFYKQLDGNKR